MGKAKRAQHCLRQCLMVGTLRSPYDFNDFGEATMSVVSADIEPLTFVFADDGLVPNNPMPFLVYKGAVDVANDHPEKTIEGLFGANGWGAMWRNGVYDYLHYHSTVHEALGVARGHARVQFGGDHGKALDISAGDVAILPAGTGHQLISASEDFCVVGAYPPGPANADHAADAGEPRESAEDDSASECAEDRSGARSARSADAVMETRLTLRLKYFFESVYAHWA